MKGHHVPGVPYDALRDRLDVDRVRRFSSADQARRVARTLDARWRVVTLTRDDTPVMIVLARGANGEITEVLAGDYTALRIVSVNESSDDNTEGEPK